MAHDSAQRWQLAVIAILLATAAGFAADIPDNLITNGGFEAGMQIWKGDGKIVLLPDGNRVCEVEASKSRLKDIKQEFHMKQLQQVEVVFRARSINYVGLGLRISIHQHGGGSIIWNRPLPQDGSWGHFRLVYTRASANSDQRELNIATQLGTGQVQIDDVEVREPSKVVADNEPPQPVAAPAATPAPAQKAFPPVALVKPPAPPIPAVPSAPAKPLPPPNVPPGTFGSLEQIIQSAPADSLRKLQDPETVDAGVTEINDYLARNVKNKPAQFRVRVESAGAMTETRNKFRIRATDGPVLTWSGGSTYGRLWAYFLGPSVPAEGNTAIGSEITVSGVIGRCDVTSKGRLQFNIDLQQSKVEAP